MRVKEFLNMALDIDVYDDVCEELGIAFCGPAKLTKAGKKHFAEALKLEVKLHNNGSDVVAIVSVDDPDEDIFECNLAIAKELFESLAGYCPIDDYQKWFEEV
ncbi:MAG: hypothetical protein J6S14_02180 [Clostridia bacterium]|nr:hypothetical protein [Clostridia bacterium]